MRGGGERRPRGRAGEWSSQVQLGLYLITLWPPSCFSGWKVALCLEIAISVLHAYVPRNPYQCRPVPPAAGCRTALGPLCSYGSHPEPQGRMALPSTRTPARTGEELLPLPVQSWKSKRVRILAISSLLTLLPP